MRSPYAGQYALFVDGVFAGMLQSFDGCAIEAPTINQAIGPDGITHKHLGPPLPSTCSFEVGLRPDTVVSSWINLSLISSSMRTLGFLKLPVLPATSSQRVDVFSATITRVALQAIDRTSGGPAFLRVDVVGAPVRLTTVTDFSAVTDFSVHPIDAATMQFALSGLSLPGPSRVEGLGFVVPTAVAPVVADIRVLVDQTDTANRAALDAWGNSFIVQGNSGDASERTGTLTLTDGAALTWTVTLSQVGINSFKLAPVTGRQTYGLYFDTFTIAP